MMELRELDRIPFQNICRFTDGIQSGPDDFLDAAETFFMQVDVQNALKLIGNEGSITIWMNAAKALGYRANRMLPMNEAVVVNVELLDVKTVKPTPQPVTNHITVPAKGNNNKVAPQGKAALKRPEIVPVKK